MHSLNKLTYCSGMSKALLAEVECHNWQHDMPHIH